MNVELDARGGSPERAALGAAWLRNALMEHASVAALARFTLELLAVGAPADLIRDSNAAASDETRHAELCFALAASTWVSQWGQVRSGSTERSTGSAWRSSW